MKRSLVTTALEDTWPNKSKPILFLGQWCRLYNRKKKWQNLDAIVAPYHWDDREKLYNDYKYITKLYESILLDLTEKLNSFHSVNYSVRYWRILLGPWLGYFIHILFDRWYMLKQVIESGEVSQCNVLENEFIKFTPNDFPHFLGLKDEYFWNEKIYSQIIKICWPDILKINVITTNFNNNFVFVNQSNKISFMQFFNYLITKISGLLPKKNNYFFISNTFSKKISLLIQLKLGQIPKLWQSNKIKKYKLNPSIRQWTLGCDKVNINTFEYLVRKLIALHLPKNYFEGYESEINTVGKLSWPELPRAIFTSIAHHYDDLFKFWAAEKTEKGVPLIIEQHGGGFGMRLFSFEDEHQIKIADKVLSWGWEDSTNKNIIPIANFRYRRKSISYKPKGDAVMIFLEYFNLQSSNLFSTPLSSQYLDYFNDQIKFTNCLPDTILDKFFLKFSNDNFGWAQKERLLDINPKLQFAEEEKIATDIMAESRIVVSTYQGTHYLESLLLNVPTIIFFNTKHWEMNHSTKPYFKLLESVGIFHETPESAAAKIINIWNDVDGWWRSSEVQKARIDFCNNYSRTFSNQIEHLINFFKNLESIQ